MKFRFVLVGVAISFIGLLTAISGTAAPNSTGAAAYYSPSWDATTIFYRHHSWGNTVADAVHPPYPHYCVHPDYRPGQVLSITAPVGTTTCLIFDSVAASDEAYWRSNFVLEVDWNTFHALGLNHNNQVTVHGLAGSPAVVNEPVGAPDTGCETFDVTGYEVCDEFLDFWNSNGGVMIFGYPLSEAYEEDGILIQVFERSVFELHPDNSDDYRVLLRRLGYNALNLAEE